MKTAMTACMMFLSVFLFSLLSHSEHRRIVQSKMTEAVMEERMNELAAARNEAYIKGFKKGYRHGVDDGKAQYERERDLEALKSRSKKKS